MMYFCIYSKLLQLHCIKFPCWQGVLCEMEQVQSLLSGARGQEGGVQHPHHRVEPWREGRAGAQRPQTHQSSVWWSHQLCFQWSSPQVEPQIKWWCLSSLCIWWSGHITIVHVLFLFFSKFINMMMKHGNKVLAKEIMTQVTRKLPLIAVRYFLLVLCQENDQSHSLLSDPGEHKEEAGGEIPQSSAGGQGSHRV